MGVRGGDNENLQVAAGMTRRHAKPRSSGGHNGKRPAAAPMSKMTRNNEMGTRKKSQAVWRPAVPSWEKEFCLKAIGLYPTWDKFVEAKKYIHLYDNIMQWDDKGAQESFNHSKTLFYAKKFKKNNILETLTPPYPDLYIDKIDYDDSKINDSELLKGLGSTIKEEEEMDESNVTTQPRGSWDIAIEDIKPTGWDVEPEEFKDPYNLTGLIVGGQSEYWF